MEVYYSPRAELVGYSETAHGKSTVTIYDIAAVLKTGKIWEVLLIDLPRAGAGTLQCMMIAHFKVVFGISRGGLLMALNSAIITVTSLYFDQKSSTSRSVDS